MLRTDLTTRARRASPAAAEASLNEKKLASAFEHRPVTGYDVQIWQMNEKLSKWDGAFAIGFTSYQAMLRWTKEMTEQPIDPVRELLIRLYKIEATFPVHLVPPSLELMVEYLFGLTATSAVGLDSNKKCASLLAVLLGKNRGSGYRWARAAATAGKSAQVPVLRLCSKLFSMREETARSNFWKAAFAMAGARVGDNPEMARSIEAIREILDANGVSLD